MVKLVRIYFFVVFGFLFLEAQDSIGRKAIANKYNILKSTRFSNQLKKQIKLDSVEVQKYIAKHKLSKEQARGIIKIAENGIPLRIKPHSLNQINATNTNLITNNRVSGLNLTGNGITAYVFDNGAILTKHKEFDYRVSNNRLNNKVIDYHSTWVAGVMAAKGLRADATGMAKRINIVGETYNNSSLYDRINELASSGVILSNHSYGYSVGWSFNDEDGIWEWWGDPSISILEDYNFGYYSEVDSDIDNIINLSPYHLMVMAAGNSNDTFNRGEGPDGDTEYILINDQRNFKDTTTDPRNKNCSSGFDCIPQGNLGKNTLTIGSVDPLSDPNISANIKLSNFSSVGPTDDGRIKPDLVAVGSDVLTPSIETITSYSAVEGTSFSSPSVAGIAALLQEQYLGLKGEYMRSDLVKALLINTTNEAGNADGPDYKFGWGLVDAYKAAMIIKNNKNTTFLDQLTLTNGNNCKMEIKVNAGSKVNVTLAWVDKEYTAYSPSLNNRTKTLVNDLDIRVYEKNNPNIIFLPWKLDVNNPNAAATKGDNDTDNLEQVEFTPSTTTDYIVEVKHKGNLVEPTNYSLVMNAKPLTFCKIEEETNELSVYFLNGTRLFVKSPLINVDKAYQFSIYDYTGKLVINTIEKDYIIDLKKYNLVQGNYIGVVKSNEKSANLKFSIN